MSDVREPKEYLLYNTIIMAVVWTDGRTGESIGDYTTSSMRCYVRHEDDASATQVTVSTGADTATFEASYTPTKTGHFHYAFILDEVPAAIADGDFEIVMSDVGVIPNV